MVRVCDALICHGRIMVVGLCHRIFIAYCFAGMSLANDLDIEIPISITSMQADILEHSMRWRAIHLILMLVDLHAAETGHAGAWVRTLGSAPPPSTPKFEPLTRCVFDAFGLFPISDDIYLGAYLAWLILQPKAGAWPPYLGWRQGAAARYSQQTRTLRNNVKWPGPKPWDKYNIRLHGLDVMAGSRDFRLQRLNELANANMIIGGLLDKTLSHPDDDEDRLYGPALVSCRQSAADRMDQLPAWQRDRENAGDDGWGYIRYLWAAA